MAKTYRYAALIALAVLLGCAGLACDSKEKPSAPVPSAKAHAKDASKIVGELGAKDLPVDKRLDAIHRAGDEKIDAAIPRLRALLSSKHPDVVVAAAAALAQLHAPHADADVVEAAGRLSRDRQYEHLREILFVVGEIGGPASRTYLKAVADGYDVPPIRQTAAQVLEDLPPRTKP